MEINGAFLLNKISMLEEVSANPQKYQSARLLFSKKLNPQDVFVKLKPQDSKSAQFAFRLAAERMCSSMNKSDIKFNLEMIDEWASKINNYFRQPF